MDESVFGQYNQQAQQKKQNGPENDYTKALGLLGGSTGKGGGDAASQAGGAVMGGSTYDMGHAIQGLWKSSGTNPDIGAMAGADAGAGAGAAAGGGGGMGSIASIAMAFL